MLKQQKIVYWIATALISAMMLFSSYSYVMNPDMEMAFTHLGFPSYFRVELAIAKVIGAILLVLPVPPVTKHWVYAGFSFTYVSASLAHFMAGDPIIFWVSPLLFLGVLLISYTLFCRLRKQDKL